MRIRKHARLFSSLISPSSPILDGPATTVSVLNRSLWDAEAALSPESRNENKQVKIEENQTYTSVGKESVYASAESSVKKVEKEVEEQDVVEEKEEKRRYSMLGFAVREKGKEKIEVKRETDYIRCRITSGKGWQCKREVKVGKSICEHHYIKRKLCYQSNRSRSKRNKGNGSSALASDFYYPSHSQGIDEGTVNAGNKGFHGDNGYGGVVEQDEEEKEERRFSTLGFAIKEKAKEKPEVKRLMSYIHCSKYSSKEYKCNREAKEGRKLCEFHLLKQRKYYRNKRNLASEKSIQIKQSQVKAGVNRKRNRGEDWWSSSSLDYYYYSGFGPSYSRVKDKGDEQLKSHRYKYSPSAGKCLPVIPVAVAVTVAEAAVSNERITNRERDPSASPSDFNYDSGVGLSYSWGRKSRHEIKKEEKESVDVIDQECYSSLVQVDDDGVYGDCDFHDDGGDQKRSGTFIKQESVSLSPMKPITMKN